MNTETTPPQTAAAPVKHAVAKGVGITESAAKRLAKLLVERQTPEAGLRVAVKGGGCSGLTYVMEWAEKPRDKDKIAERDGVRVFVDPKSYLYLMGSDIDFVETLMQSGFQIKNPNVKTACGCGESFTV
ncbi:MAG: HesB/IscA family protein [Myxococcaceae bacterium]